MRESVIVSAVRTPTGKFLGGLKDFSAPDLGALVVREAVQRAGIDPERRRRVHPGQRRQRRPRPGARAAGGAARRSANGVGALTINKVCGSGLKAVMLAAQGIATGDIDIAVAGGMESMSNCPYLLTRVREGLRMGDGTVVDSMIHDGLWDSFHDIHMGLTGEHVSETLPRDARAAGRLRRRKPSQARRARDARGLVHGRDPAGLDSAEEGRPDRRRSRRVDSRGHDRRSARDA